jgi:hypothetical protein
VIAIHDDVLPDPEAYRQRALAGRFQTIAADALAFHGIQPCADPTVPLWLVQTYPGLRPTLSFFRQSPLGQVEPHYRHDDRSMGDVTAILYLTPQPPDGDGTLFWRNRHTGAVASQWETPAEMEAEAVAWFDPDQWDLAGAVAAKFNRVVVFPAAFVHSRSLEANYGAEADGSARLIQVVFCRGSL